MKIHNIAIPTAYLKPGELFFSEVATQAITVLGSCLAVTMHSPRLRIGAICHGLFAQCGDKEACTGSCAEEFKYVDCSITYMLKRFTAFGVRPMEIEIKVFGGADVIGMTKTTGAIGTRNIETAFSVLEGLNLPVKATDVGGTRGRKIIFNTFSGDVFLKRL